MKKLLPVMLTLLLLFPATNPLVVVNAESNISAGSENYDELLRAYNLLESEYESLLSNYTSLAVELDSLRRTYDSLQSDYTSLSAQFDSLWIAYDSLSSNNTRLAGDFEILRSSYESVLGGLVFAKNLIYVLIATAAALAVIAFVSARKRK